MRLSRTISLAMALVASLACTERSGEGPVSLDAIDSLPSPAAPGSAEPNLSVTPDGRILLSWLEPPQPDSTVALRLATLEADAWSPPRTITRSESLFVNWADFPSVLALPNGDLVAHWLQKSGAGKYAYDVRTARSRDGGATWNGGTVLHTDRTEGEHGFVSLWAEDDSTMGAAWLDGRSAEATAMILVHRSVGPGAESNEQVLDERVCDCCQTAAALTSRGPVVAYRDRSLSPEVRDIALVRRVEGRWTEPRLVHEDGWHIEACPVNGPAIAASGHRVAVAWFTAARDTARVQVAFSTDAGVTFAPPIRVDDGAPAGRVGVALDDRGGAFVSWIERRGGEEAEVRVRHVVADGALGDAVAIASSTAARASGFPRMARSGDALIFAWTAPGAPSVVRIARARLREP